MTKVQIVAEGPTDYALLVALVRRVLNNTCAALADTVEFVGAGTQQPYWQKGSLKGRLKRKGLRGVTGRGLTPASRVVKTLQLLNPDVAAIVLHDTDGESSIHNAYVDALTGNEDQWAWLLATPHPEQEAWQIWIAGHQADVQQRGRDLRRRIGVDPVLHPDRLSSSPRSQRNCKAVARRLQLPDPTHNIEFCRFERLLESDKTHLKHFILCIQKWARSLET